MSDAASSLDPIPGNSGVLEGTRVAFVGKLASMSKREAARLVRGHGGSAVDKPDASVQLIVVGEAELPLPGDELDQWLGLAHQPGLHVQRR